MPEEALLEQEVIETPHTSEEVFEEEIDIEENPLEEEYKLLVEEIGRELKSAETELQEVFSDPLIDLPEREALQETLTDHVQKTARKVLLLSAIGFASVDTQQDSYTTNETHLHHSHPDQTTTKILNYLSGHEDVDYETRLEILREEIGLLSEKSRIPLPDLSEMEENQLLAAYNMLRPLSKPRTASLFDEFPDLKRGSDDPLYEKLWKLHKENGSPKLRLRLLQDPYRAEYFFSENTAYISIPNEEKLSKETNKRTLQALKEYIAELAHAQQAVAKNRKTTDEKRVFTEEVLKEVEEETGIDREVLREKTYKHEIFTEGEAHLVREPKIKREIQVTLDINADDE